VAITTINFGREFYDTNYTNDSTEKTAEIAEIAEIYQRKIQKNPRNPRLFSVNSRIFTNFSDFFLIP